MTLQESFTVQLARRIGDRLEEVMPEIEPSVIHSHCLAALEMLIAGIWLEHTVRASGMIGHESPVVYVIHDC
jgi:hypothetical protein